MVSTMTGTSQSPQTQFGGAIQANLLVFDGFGRWARAEGAQAEILETNFRHNATLDDIALRVKEAFFTLIAAKELLAATMETRGQSEILLNMAKARHENGLVAKTDVLWAKTNLAEAELLFTRAKNGVQIATGNLAVAMGLPVATPLQIAKAPLVTPHRKVEELLAIASRRRPELGGALAVVKKRKAALKEAKASWWPVVTIEGSYGHKDDIFLPKQDEWSIGIGLSLPCFTGFKKSYDVRRAEAAVAQAQAGFEALLRDVEFSVWARYHEMVSALEAIRASRALAAFAAEGVAAAQEEYKNGIGSMPDLIAAQAARTRAETGLIRARLEREISLARLERASGMSLAGTNRKDGRER